MATKKDLVEAHAFSRRRLVTAFLSGAPGGREVEPSRPGRMVVGGLALAVLLVAGAAIASVLASRTPADWNQVGAIRAEDGQQLYVILREEKNPTLLPIANATSAQLLFGADSPTTTVSQETIDGERSGDTIGIAGAPPELPRIANLVETGWTACSGDNLGIKVAVATRPDVGAGRGAAYTVRTTDGSFYVLATGVDSSGVERARYLPVPDEPASDGVLAGLGLPVRQAALVVPNDFVPLFEEGGALSFDSFGFDAAATLPAGLAGVPGAQVGAVVTRTDARGEETGLVMTGDGLLQLDPFALAVYRGTTLPGTNGPPPDLGDVDLPQVPYTDQLFRDAGWPVERPSGTPAGQVCAVLDARADRAPAVRLGVEPEGVASAGEIAPDERPVDVQPGHGAFVYVGLFDDATGDDAFVVNSQGNIYPLEDRESIVRLGYSSVPAPVVPDTWLELFNEGVALSTTQALCPPRSDDQTSTDPECASREAEPEASGSSGAAS